MSLPPTSTKGSGDSAYKTTFKTDYDSIPVTHTGVTTKIGTIPVIQGGTGSTTPTTARQSIGGQTVFNGIEDSSLFSISYVEGTRTLTVTSASGAVTVNGVRYTPVTESLVHTNATGLHFYFYNSSGVLTVTTTPFDLLNSASVAAVYYTTSNNGGAAGGILINELHPGVTGMDNAAHKYLHLTRGTQIVSGCTVVAGSYALTTNTLAAITPAFNSGVLADEDLQITTAAVVDGGPYRVAWKTGSSATPSWNWSDSFTAPFWNNATDIGYNQNNAGTFQMTPITVANRWVNYWVVATTSHTGQPSILFVAGETLFTSAATAIAATFASDVTGIASLTTEGVILYRITSRRVASGTTFNSQIEDLALISQSIAVSPVSGSFVDLISNQSVGGNKSFTGVTTVASLIRAVASVSTTYPITTLDNVILGDTTSAGFTVTLPTAVGFTGLSYTIKKTDATANILTVATTSAQTIDGASTLSIDTQYQAYTVISNGTNWSIIS